MKHLFLALVLSVSSLAVAAPSRTPKTCEVNIYIEADGESVYLSSALMTTAHTQIVKNFGSKNRYYKTNLESDLAMGPFFFRLIINSDNHKYAIQFVDVDARKVIGEVTLPFYPSSESNGLEIVREGIDMIYTQATASDFFKQCPK